MSVQEEIKGRLDAVSYIQQYVPLKKSGRYFKACCPFHSEKTPSFVVNPDTQTWRCFGACAEGGDIFSFGMKFHGWSFPEALEALGKQAGVEVRQQTPEERQKADHLDKLRGLVNTAAQIFHENLFNSTLTGAQGALNYVRQKRGLSEDTIKQFGIGYAPSGWQNLLNALTQLGYDEDMVIEAGMAVKNDSGRVYDRFRNRLIIPIRDARGRTIGFGARALDPDDNPKYLNSPQTPLFDKSKILFGLDVAKSAIRESETVIIVEGYMDVVQAHQGGFQNVVAQMGTAMTEAQLDQIAPRLAKKVVLALDADAAGQNATRRSLETARRTLEADYEGRLSVDIRVLQIPGAKDPDDLIRETPDRWAALVENALPVADYVISTETATLPPEASSAPIQQREAIAQRILPLLIASENDLYKQANIQKLAVRLRIDYGHLMQMAAALRARIEKDRRPSSHQKGSNHQDSERVSTANEEPPFPDIDMVEPPPDTDDLGLDDITLPGTPAATVNVSEGHCLRVLLQNPSAIYQINRKFRELAEGNAALQRGPLRDIGVDDFTHGDYRALMSDFLSATRQHELDVHDYLNAQLHGSLKQVMAKLLVDESEGVHKRVQKRYQGDFADIWKRYDRRNPHVDGSFEAIEKAIRLRLLRIKRDETELKHIQMEAQAAGDQTTVIETGMRIAVLLQARRLLEPELQRQQDIFS